MAQPFPYIKDAIYGEGDVPINFFPYPHPVYKEVLMRTPGLLQHAAITDCAEGRGIYPWNGYLYVVNVRGTQSVLWRVDPVTGTYAEMGTITTSSTGPVYFADNPTQLCIVDGVSGYVFTPATGIFEQISDANFPGAGMLAYESGLGLFTKPNSNQWFFSNLYDFKTYDALNFYSFESKTGNIVGLIVHHLEPYIFGEKGTEVWYFAGGDNSSADNPTFARNTTGVIEYGCGALGSINTADGTVVNWITEQGEWVAAAGYNAAKASPQIMDAALAAMPKYDDARAFSWRDGGHVFTAMTFPSGDQTWVRDWTAKATFKMTSYLTDGSGWGRHRLNCICKLNNELFGLDYENGKVYKVSRDYLDDDSHPTQRILHTINYDAGSNQFDFGEMALIINRGIGTLGATALPQVMMQWSKDSGKNWSSAYWRDAGAIGDFKKQPPTWNRNGSSQRRMIRFIMTDAVDWQINGFDFQMQLLKG